MSLENDLLGPDVSPLVRGEKNVVGQPGGGPLASGIQPTTQRRFRAYDSEAANAAGLADIIFAGPPSGYCWEIGRIVVQGGGTASVYVGTVDDQGLADFTPTATIDVADENTPIYVPGGQTVTVRFLGAGAGTVCKVGLQIEVKYEG